MSAESMWVFTFFQGFFLYFQAMLICTCRKEDCVTIKPMESSHGITLDGCIEVAYMGFCINIEDGRGDHYFF